jgi:hypothetical protein
MPTEKKETTVCPFCDFNIPDDIGPMYIQYNCPVHGRYNISDMFIGEYKECLKRDPLFLKRISRYLYETRDSSGFRLVDGYSFSIARDHYAPKGPNRVLLLDQATSLYKTELSPLQKYEQTLYSIATRSVRFGQTFTWAADRYIVPTMDDNEAMVILNTLSENGYLKQDVTMTTRSFRLTEQGFRRVENIRQSAKTGLIVFVAACITPELDLARSTIANTLKDLGYEPYLVDLDPHQDIIDVRIYDNIRQSKFMVADLTYNRQSVYYEVGFAHGLGIEVILTCRSDSFKDASDDFKRVHFDLEHRNILTWESEGELRDKVEKHILQSFGRYTVSK